MFTNMTLAMASNMVATATWDLTTFLQKATDTVRVWSKFGIMLLGVVMIAVGIYQVGSGLISHGKKQTNWIVAILLILLGGTISASGGYQLVLDVANSGKTTIEDLGKGKTDSTITNTYETWLLPDVFDYD